jgi:hypothetical protein
MFRAPFCPSSGALLNCSRSLRFPYKSQLWLETSTLAFIRETEAASAVQKCSWWWTKCCPKHAEQRLNNKRFYKCNYSLEAPDDERQYRLKHVEGSRNNGIINCPTQLHLVAHFYKICIMMHGSINVKVVRLLAACTGRFYPPGIIPVTHFCKRMSGP